MRWLPALMCHIAILLAVYFGTSSTIGFLVVGTGLTVLVDKYVLRAAAWRPFAWRKELFVRIGSFVIGTTGFYWVRPGVVPLWETARCGGLVLFAVVLAELSWDLARRFSAGWLRRFCIRATLLALSIALIPELAFFHPLHTVPKRGPGSLGLQFEDVRFGTADGVRLSAWLIPHSQARGNLIFCHGHGRNRGQSAALLRTLHDLELNVLAFDFRGHGDSEGYTSTFGDREVADVQAAEAYMRGRYPGQPLLLVGVSLGGAVSLQSLPLLPGIKGVWSESSFARLRGPVEYQLARVPLVGCDLPSLYYLLGWLDCGVWTPDINPIDRLRGISVPIFFCHGVNDELVPLAEGKALHDAYDGPKQHWWVEGASHYNVRQRNTEEYLSRLRGFLQDCLAKK